MQGYRTDVADQSGLLGGIDGGSLTGLALRTIELLLCIGDVFVKLSTLVWCTGGALVEGNYLPNRFLWIAEMHLG